MIMCRATVLFSILNSVDECLVKFKIIHNKLLKQKKFSNITHYVSNNASQILYLPLIITYIINKGLNIKVHSKFHWVGPHTYSIYFFLTFVINPARY